MCFRIFFVRYLRFQHQLAALFQHVLEIRRQRAALLADMHRAHQITDWLVVFANPPDNGFFFAAWRFRCRLAGRCLLGGSRLMRRIVVFRNAVSRQAKGGSGK